MFLYWTVIGKRTEIILTAGTRTQNLFQRSGGGRKWHITGPRPLSFSAAALCYRVKTHGSLCCTRQVTEYSCQQRCCHWWLRLPTRSGSFLIPRTDSRYVSTCTSQEFVFHVLLPPTAIFPAFFAIAVIYYELVGSGSLIFLKINSSCQNTIPGWILITLLPTRTCLFLSIIYYLSMKHPFWLQLGRLKLAFAHWHSLDDLYQTDQTPSFVWVYEQVDDPIWKYSLNGFIIFYITLKSLTYWVKLWSQLERSKSQVITQAQKMIKIWCKIIRTFLLFLVKLH